MTCQECWHGIESGQLVVDSNGSGRFYRLVELKLQITETYLKSSLNSTQVISLLENYIYISLLSRNTNSESMKYFILLSKSK